MDISNILTEDCTKRAVLLHSKKRVLEYISQLFSHHCNSLLAEDILKNIQAREILGSTGIGHGIAIPHCRLPNIQDVHGVLIVTEQAIDFDAIDNRPVDIFFALLLPEEDDNQHLTTLSSIAKLLGNKKLCRAIRHASSDLNIYETILGHELNHH
ncbi:PTS sugar transporter subunit IIA [Algicola sagamiensis]|uniref:PTS sugar transporter subunit IIA n=1 Tax=Algicola sagamiensis TaxID=163869 RepID=UPI0003697A97|nr:PTS sugar transporter subunit IIA [Algicola sagamiensis]